MTAADIDRAEEMARHRREYLAAWEAVKLAETSAAMDEAWAAMMAARSALGLREIGRMIR